MTSRIEGALVCNIRPDTRGKTRVQPFFLEIEVEQLMVAICNAAISQNKIK